MLGSVLGVNTEKHLETELFPKANAQECEERQLSREKHLKKGLPIAHPQDSKGNTAQSPI